MFHCVSYLKGLYSKGLGVSLCVFYLMLLYNEILDVSVHCYLTQMCDRGLCISLYVWGLVFHCVLHLTAVQ